LLDVIPFQIEGASRMARHRAEWSPCDTAPDGKNGGILAPICGFFGQKGLKNTEKGAKFGEFQLLVSQLCVFV
jgi:hypothetical protein